MNKLAFQAFVSFALALVVCVPQAWALAKFVRQGASAVGVGMYDDEQFSEQFRARALEQIRTTMKWAIPGVQVISCQNYVHIPVGTARGNHSYGASCMIEADGKQVRRTICTDQMVGHFAMTLQPLTPTRAIKFVKEHCFGG